MVFPGQGILTVLIGLMLVNFPGKRALEQRLQKVILVCTPDERPVLMLGWCMDGAQYRRCEVIPAQRGDAAGEPHARA
jgi:hypothetical protein